MGLYIRKSVRVGPFRFNLSKSGVGVSAGVKGFRVGVSPKGNYVRIGAKGVYYKTTFSNGSKKPTNESTFVDDRVIVSTPSETHEQLQEIESADVSQIVDSSSEELLSELNTKRRKAQNWPVILILFIIVSLVVFFAGWPQWTLAPIAFLGWFLTWYFYTKDLVAKTTVLFYEFEPEMKSAYEDLLNAAKRMQECAQIWHIAASGRVLDQKYHAGASDLVERKTTKVQIADPPDLKTNIQSVAVAVGRQTLHFLPDRVLVYDVNGVGAVNYKSLNVNTNEKRFIEDGSVPYDAKVIDRTWKFVNKSGGPDRRFKDNHEIPVCLYEEMNFTSRTGLNERIQLSSCGKGEQFKNALESLALRIPEEIIHSSQSKDFGSAK